MLRRITHDFPFRRYPFEWKFLAFLAPRRIVGRARYWPPIPEEIASSVPGNE